MLHLMETNEDVVKQDKMFNYHHSDLWTENNPYTG
jgi:hypothetical protein